MTKVTPGSNEEWTNEWYDTRASGGRFQRHESQFRNWITADGSPGPSGTGGFRAEAGRYHLYVSQACPWAHRTLIYRQLKGLEDMISVSSTRAYMGPKGWSFEPDQGRLFPSNDQVEYLYEIYRLVAPHYEGRATVPLLWDKERRTIVSNESAEIIRMFDTAFDEIGATPGDYYPDHLRVEIDQLNAWIYPTLNNGVYKAGFATTQEAASTPSTTATSSATSTAWSTIPTCGATPATFTSCPASPQPWTWHSTSVTTMAATTPSIRP